MADSDTIYALATPPGRSALAVFRISGSRAAACLELLTRGSCPATRQAALRSLFDPITGEKIDEAIVVFFRGPASFTGEDVVELTVHGGRGVVSAVAGALAKAEHTRAAEPGEFTRRAYTAGKFDLTQAEAIADLIDSETEFQRRQALRLLYGGLGRKAESWRTRLLAIAAEIESSLDFSDEGDVESADLGSLAEAAMAIVREIDQEIVAGARSMTLRNGFTVVIAGAPNAGKSTLFNALAGSEIAIVTEYAGTTRDLLKIDLDLDGAPVTVVDTAGIRTDVGPIETIGIDRALDAISSADLVLHLRSGDTKPTDAIENVAADVLDVWSKSDLFPPPPQALAISASDARSIADLVAVVRERALESVGDGSQGSLIRERHSFCLSEAAAAMGRFGRLVENNELELAAEEVRLANSMLGRISGAFDAEDVLGEIFSRFCIGK